MPYNLLIFIHIISLVFSAPSCTENQNFCKHCNMLLNLCAKCEKSSILVPDKNGGCEGAQNCFSGRNFCNKCDDEDKLCKVCETNYYPDNNGGCAYTEGCEISYMGECLKCSEDFVLIGKENNFQLCKSLSMDIYNNCQEINYETGYCKECKKGYYLNSGDFKCIKTENCKESIYDNCILCNKGYYFNKKENKCKIKSDEEFTFCKETLDDKKCDTCDDGYFFDENGMCIKTQFCSESENLKCKKCLKGYYLSDNGYCTNTDNCDIADKITSLCISCKKNYYLDTEDFECKSNLEDNSFKYCKKVNNKVCINCEVNYYLGEDSQCSSSDFCSESENGKCLLCQKHYYLGLDNACTNVKNCIKSNFGICIECKEGFYYNKLNNTCIEEQEPFLNCKYTCDDGTKCCECKDNFYLYENNSLCYENTKGETFFKCALVDNSKEKCLRCLNGYYLGSNDNKCSKVKNCKFVGDENKCLECDEFYCLDVKNQKCLDNNYLSEVNDIMYISCNRTNEEGTACEECINGYILSEEGYCVDKDICKEKNGEKCLKCKDVTSINGYKFCANEVFGCLESKHDNCLRCDNLENLNECTECQKGYKKSINGCVKSD